MASTSLIIRTTVDVALPSFLPGTPRVRQGIFDANVRSNIDISIFFSFRRVDAKHRFHNIPCLREGLQESRVKDSPGDRIRSRLESLANIRTAQNVSIDW